MSDRQVWVDVSEVQDGPSSRLQYYDYDVSNNPLGEVRTRDKQWFGIVGELQNSFWGKLAAQTWVETFVKNKSDNVNHPKHYTAHPSGVECITITRHMNFNLGNVIKYLWRAGIKSSVPIEDLKKAKWYLEDEIAQLEKTTMFTVEKRNENS